MNRLPWLAFKGQRAQSVARARSCCRGGAGEHVITSALALRGELAACRAAECNASWVGVEQLRTLSAILHGSTVTALEAERKRREDMDAAAEAEARLRAA